MQTFSKPHALSFEQRTSINDLCRCSANRQHFQNPIRFALPQKDAQKYAMTCKGLKNKTGCMQNG
jgi:hypothetical protein